MAVRSMKGELHHLLTAMGQLHQWHGELLARAQELAEPKPVASGKASRPKRGTRRPKKRPKPGES